MLKQLIAVISMSLQTVPQRLGASSVIVIGIAGVVAVLVSVLAMGAGFKHTLADSGREAIESSQYAAPLYNLACCESLAGRPADAVEHLRRAIELSERFRSYAKDDSDFDAIREEPAFKELVG